MDIFNKKEVKIPRKRKNLFKKNILFRLAIFSWLMIVVTLIIFVAATLPMQRNSLMEGMRSKAGAIATSIDQVVASALVAEDYSFVVEHCMRLVEERPSVLYVLIVRRDGFSLVFTGKGWEKKEVGDKFALPRKDTAQAAMIYDETVADEKAYCFSYPFSYSGIDWGRIYVGLSLEDYEKSLKFIYARTIQIALVCVFIGVIISYFFAKKLTGPILALTAATEKVAGGDLSVKAEILTGDEIEDLARSFNAMTETLRESSNALTAAKDYAENIIGSMTDALVVIDPEGKIVTVNKATCKLLNREENDIIGRDVEVLFSSHTISKFGLVGRKFVKFILENPKESYEITFVTKEDVPINVLFSISVILDEKGEVEGLIGVAKDITGITRTEKELRRVNDELKTNEKAVLNILADLQKSHSELKNSQEQLLRSEKLASLGRLVSDMAHEVNNPLMIISGRAQLAMMDEVNTKEAKENLRIIVDQCERAKEVIHRLLLFSKPSKGVMADVDINEVLDFVVKLLEHQYTLINIKMIRKYGRNLPPVKIDEKQMHEVFMNLLKNSAEAMTEGGTITVLTTTEDDKVRIEIKDTGQGISEENLRKLFDPFFTTKEQGTGLGLSVCYGIVQSHGGELSYESKLGEGTTAIVRLPVSKE